MNWNINFEKIESGISHNSAHTLNPPPTVAWIRPGSYCEKRGKNSHKE